MNVYFQQSDRKTNKVSTKRHFTVDIHKQRERETETRESKK